MGTSQDIQPDNNKYIRQVMTRHDINGNNT